MHEAALAAASPVVASQPVPPSAPGASDAAGWAAAARAARSVRGPGRADVRVQYERVGTAGSRQYVAYSK